jgi:hypothetical protein
MYFATKIINVMISTNRLDCIRDIEVIPSSDLIAEKESLVDRNN